jgi:hypothetical protein
VSIYYGCPFTPRTNGSFLDDIPTQGLTLNLDFIGGRLREDIGGSPGSEETGGLLDRI